MKQRVAVGILIACAAVGTWTLSMRTPCEPLLAQRSVSTGHTSRPYLLYTSHAGGAQPLVLVFHGGGGPLATAELMMAHSGWKEVAEKKCISIAFLSGSPEHSSREAQPDMKAPEYNPLIWNTTETDTEDIDYVSHVLDDIRNQIHVDEDRIYATGFSNGGTFSYKLAHALPHVFAGIAAVEAAALEYAPTPSTVSLLVISGVPIELQNLPDTPAVSWASRAGCTSNSVSKKGTITERIWSGCSHGAAREIFVHGMGHEYPGAAYIFGTDPQYTDAVSAAKEAWSFFSKQGRD